MCARLTYAGTDIELSRDTSPCTRAHVHTRSLIRATHTRSSSSCCRASQSRLCLTSLDVSSILSEEDEDEFLSYHPAVMVLPSSSRSRLVAPESVRFSLVVFSLIDDSTHHSDLFGLVVHTLSVVYAMVYQFTPVLYLRYFYFTQVLSFYTTVYFYPTCPLESSVLFTQHEMN